MYILVNIKRHVSANSWPSSGLTISLKFPLCKWAMMWRSQYQSLLCTVYMLLGKEGGKETETICHSGVAGVFCRGKVSSCVALFSYLVMWGEGPLLCAVPVWSYFSGCGLLAIVRCYEHCVTVYPWVSLFVSLVTLVIYRYIYIYIYISFIYYCVRCVGQRCGVFPCCILALYSVRVWRDMSGKLVWSSRRGAWVLEGQWVWGWGPHFTRYRPKAESETR
jgi:hypothetical protein